MEQLRRIVRQAPSNAIAAYTYDSSSVSGATNTIGRVTAKSVMNNGSVVSQELPYSYDAMGRLLAESQCPLGNCSTPYSMYYTYDLSGNLTSGTNGESSTNVVNVGYGYDSAGRLCLVTNTGAPGSCTLPSSNAALFYAQSYGAAGLLSAEYGVTSSNAAAISQTRAYDNRLRLLSETDTGTSLATAGTGSSGTISISGSEQSVSVGSSYGSATVTVSGSEGYNIVKCYENKYTGDDTCTYSYDSGTVGVSISGFSVTASYARGSTASSVASDLTSLLNASGSPVTAKLSGAVITLTSAMEGSNGNYAITLTSGSDFTLKSSSSTLTGGANTAVYDTGAISATVNGNTSAVSWAQGSTASSIASTLGSEIANANKNVLNVAVSGSIITLTSIGTGAVVNYSISTSATDTASSNFSSASFSASSSGMSGGTDAGYSNGTLYSFSIPSSGGYATNGNLLSFTDSVIGSWNFAVNDANGYSGYDPLNRMTAGYASSGLYAGMYACWTYDAFGNRTMEAISSTACNASPTPSSWAQYNGTINGTNNNQMSATNTNTSQGSSGYDIAGNVTNDGRNAYLYDIEGRLCAVQSGGNGGAATGYLYNADGQRVAKGYLSSFACPTSAASLSTVQSQYLLGQSGEQVTELDGSGNWVHTNVWAGGRLIATYEGSDLYYALTDWLGTKRAELGAASLCTSTYASLPFGNDQTQISGSCPDATEHHFTTKEHDSESGNDYFLARYYASNLGRFLTPDWSAKTDPVPYAKTDNPQSLNLYAYVLNNPLRSFDADGHEGGDGQNGGGSNGGSSCPDAQNNPCNVDQKKQSELQKNTDASKEHDPTLPTEVQPPPASMADKIMSALMPKTPLDLALLVGSDGFGEIAEAGSAVFRVKELASSLGKTADFVTLAVTETKEGTTVVSSSEKALRPGVRALLKSGEIAAKGEGHAEVTGVNAARQMGLTPTGVAASRGICPSCADFLRTAGVAALSAIRATLPF